MLKTQALGPRVEKQIQPCRSQGCLIESRRHFGVQRLQSQKCTRHPQGCQHPPDCPVIWASPPNKIPLNVGFGNLAPLFVSLVLSLWHSRFGGEGFWSVLGAGAFCVPCCGRTGHGYSLELVRLQGARDCDALALVMRVISPERHRAVVWFPVSLGWGCVGTVHFFRGIL